MTERRSAAAFRPATEWIDLGDGREVEVKRPDVPGLIMAKADSDEIPQPLVNQVLASIERGEQKPAVIEITRKELPAYWGFMKAITRAALVWPVVVDGTPDYDAGEIAESDLKSDIVRPVFGWVMGGAAAAASRFPDGPDAGVDAVQPVPDVPAKAGRRAKPR